MLFLSYLHSCSVSMDITTTDDRILIFKQKTAAVPDAQTLFSLTFFPTILHIYMR